MSFKFLINGKELPNRKIQWKFVDHATQFESDPERFQRNQAFWQQKLGLQPGAAIEILNGEIKEETYAESIPNNPDVESSLVESDEQPTVSQPVEDIQSTDKSKRRKKTV
jgi:hypothetical protein